MSKVSHSIRIIAATMDCYNCVKESLTDERIVEAFETLFSVKNTSRIVHEKTGEEIVVEEKGIEPLTKAKMGAWKITYHFTSIDENTTEIKISIDYGLLSALLGFGTLKLQAKTQLTLMLSALIAFEKGKNSI